MGFPALKNDRKSKGIFLCLRRRFNIDIKEIFAGRPSGFEQQFLQFWSEVFEIFSIDQPLAGYCFSIARLSPIV
jgi:hypothetical protein